MSILNQNLIDLKNISAQDIDLIIDTAFTQKEILSRSVKKVPILKGKSVCTMFVENSTRTKNSFETACKILGADVIGFSKSGSSINKGESFKDTLLTLEAMGVDLFIIRHYASGSSDFAAKTVKSRIINAGDGMHAHPTQALLDIMTIREHRGSLNGMTVLILGDVFHSRVARSNIWGLYKLGAKVRICSPNTLLPAEINNFPCEVYTDLHEAVKGVDCINILRIQLERMNAGYFSSVAEYNHFYGIDDDIFRYAGKDTLILHPGPINRGVEISSSIADGPNSVIVNQVTNGLAVRMALLYLMLQGEK
ncbi:MAG: aspartate carbamoyltransferase catalytic subunit [Armatimonadetes bacterium]|nr:aspartate carbamoyltransferase catalytic subunit [Candidatus Hippobium faecium]